MAGTNGLIETQMGHSTIRSFGSRRVVLLLVLLVSIVIEFVRLRMSAAQLRTEFVEYFNDELEAAVAPKDVETDGKKPARGKKKAGASDYIISKSRTKAAAGINVSGEFYGALDEAVRLMITGAEERAVNNNRRTLRPHDL